MNRRTFGCRKGCFPVMEWDLVEATAGPVSPAFVSAMAPRRRRQLGEGDHPAPGHPLATRFLTAGTVANSGSASPRKWAAARREAHDLDVNVPLGPGMNIKRNHAVVIEYYSKIRSSLVVWRGLTEAPATAFPACPKHFAVSQELRPPASNSVTSVPCELYPTGYESQCEAGPMTIDFATRSTAFACARKQASATGDSMRRMGGFDGRSFRLGAFQPAVAAAGGSLESRRLRSLP